MCRRRKPYDDGPPSWPTFTLHQRWEMQQAQEKWRREKEAANALLALELAAIDDQRHQGGASE